MRGGVAFAALGHTEHAREEQEKFEKAAAKVPEEWRAGANPSQEVLGLARQMLEGEISWREGKHEEAFAAMAEGARLEDELVYDEPPGWMQPVRHAYGALLMAADRPADAERIYREDLERNPGNGWSLLGLQQALTAQDQRAAADEAGAALAAVWSRADVRTGSSCFCEPGSKSVWEPPYRTPRSGPCARARRAGPSAAGIPRAGPPETPPRARPGLRVGPR